MKERTMYTICLNKNSRRSHFVLHTIQYNRCRLSVSSREVPILAHFQNYKEMYRILEMRWNAFSKLQRMYGKLKMRQNRPALLEEMYGISNPPMAKC